MDASAGLREVIEGTRWIDVHEHVVEERHVLAPGPHRFVDAAVAEPFVLPDDWTALIVLLALNDLTSAGLPAEARARVEGAELGPREKWDLVEPYWRLCRCSGYLRAVDLTTEALCDGMRLGPDTCVEIDARLRELRRPGYYRELLVDAAGVEWCQVHTLDLEADPFCATEQPDLLAQDISIVPLALGRHEGAERASGIEVAGLDDYVAVIEHCFDRHAEAAVAVKCVWAYLRPLQTRPPATPPADAFELLRAGTASAEQQREVEDFLFDVCVRLAGERGLPVKIHFGTLHCNGQPQLRHVRDHVDAAIELAQRYPQALFVCMHMAWPHQEELMAVAKHYPNVHVEISWAWSLAPRATREFVCRFLTVVPASKLLGFGGDQVVAENVVGHAALARAGLRGALEDLVDDGWLAPADALDLAPMLMRGNAERLFGAAPPGQLLEFA
jgi:uncharacterized protein